MLTSCWPRRGLALRELDGDPRLGHLVAQQAMERLGLGGLEQVVVLVVVAEPLRRRPAVLRRLLPRLLEDIELELGARLQGQARGCGARHLALEDGPRADRDLLVRLLVDRVAEHDGGLLEPRDDPHRVPDGRGDPVAVAGLPVHQPEAVGRVHLHVGAQEVGAEVRPVVDDAVEERLALDTLAHEPALHVGEGDDDRVDAPVANQLLQLGQPRVLLDVPVVAVGMRLDGRHGSCLGRCFSRGSWRRSGRRTRRCSAEGPRRAGTRSPPRSA